MEAFLPAESAALPHSVRGQKVRALDWSFIFIAVCAVLFASAVALRLNGSSAGCWARALHSVEPNGLLVGTPRPTRSDEWLVWTPAALAQLHHLPPMPVENPSLGAGATPLLMSLPVRHYSMLFRPQLWGFFWGDEEFGFSWFWNVKVFGLLLSFFLLFRMLLKGRVALAVLGSLAVSYSSYLQWFFSCPPMLPEMLASWAIMLLAAKRFFDPGAPWKKALAAGLLIASSLNFILCCYPPFEIPLLYLALAFFGAFLWQRRAHYFQGGFWWLGGALLVIGALLWPIFLQCRATLEIIAQTSYPGTRRGSGGSLPVAHLLSGLLDFFNANRDAPAMFRNRTEASNIFPIWLPALVVVGWRCWKKRASPIELALAAYLLFCLGYAIVGFPEWFCGFTALSFCLETRFRLTIGLAGLLLAFLSLRDDGRALARGRARFVGPIIVSACVLVYFWRVHSANVAYLTTGYSLLLGGTAIALASLYFCARGLVFATALAGVLVVSNVLVNPISEGLPTLLRSQAAQHISAIYHADPSAAWAVYEQAPRAQFVMACGPRVLNGIKTVPNPALLRQLDPTGAAREIYNRYALVILGLPRPGATGPVFELQAADCYREFVSPFDPILRAQGLKYVVFPRPLAPDEQGPMKLLDALPDNSIWIYQI